MTQRKVRIALATEADRPAIYRMRHDVYAAELGQHQVQPSLMLSDPLMRPMSTSSPLSPVR
jgi:hypothetical protein